MVYVLYYTYRMQFIDCSLSRTSGRTAGPSPRGLRRRNATPGQQFPFNHVDGYINRLAETRLAQNNLHFFNIA